MKNIQSKHLFLLTLGAIAMTMTVFLSCSACGKTSADTQKDAAVENSATAGAAKGTPESFHTGRFKYDDFTNFGDFIIIRSKDLQIDSGSATALVVKFGLKWENDTTYTLNYLETMANPNSIQLPELKGMYRNCIMTEATDSSYVEISTSSLNKDTLHAKILRL